MRRTAAAFATATLAVVTLAGPIPSAGAQPTDDVERITCGTVGPPACEVINELEALLAPLAPVLDLAGPALSQLGAALNELGSLGDLTAASPGVPAGQVAATAQEVLDQIGALTDPLRGLLDGAGLGALTAALDELIATVEGIPAAAGVPGADEPPSADGGEPEAQPAPARSTSATPAAGFGAPLSSHSADAGDTRVARVVRPAIPAVHTGESLILAPLGTPTFASPAARAAEEAAIDRIVEDLVLPAAAEASARAAAPDSSSAMFLVGLLSMVLLVAGLVLDNLRRSRRHVIPD